MKFFIFFFLCFLILVGFFIFSVKNKENKLADNWTCGVDKLVDVDGNSYDTVMIGGQCWMAENLRVSRNADSSKVYGSGNQNTTPPARNNDNNWEPKEGFFYNWEDAMNGSKMESAQGVCPSGWHIPSHEEWTTMERYICNSEKNGSCDIKFPKDISTTGYLGVNEGLKLKAKENVKGGAPELKGEDGYGFRGFFAGNRNQENGEFFDRGLKVFFWSSTESSWPYANNSSAWCRGLNSSFDGFNRFPNKKGMGLAIRCVKDDIVKKDVEK